MTNDRMTNDKLAKARATKYLSFVIPKRALGELRQPLCFGGEHLIY